jgi:hypothetical protein
MLEKLYLISREAGGDSAIASYWERKEAMNRHVVAQLLLAESVVTLVRRQLRQLFPGVRIDADGLTQLVRTEVIKRECLEGDRATAAERIARKVSRKKASRSTGEFRTPGPVVDGSADPALGTERPAVAGGIAQSAPVDSSAQAATSH